MIGEEENRTFEENNS